MAGRFCCTSACGKYRLTPDRCNDQGASRWLHGLQQRQLVGGRTSSQDPGAMWKAWAVLFVDGKLGHGDFQF